MSQGKEDRGSLFSVPLALRVLVEGGLCSSRGILGFGLTFLPWWTFRIFFLLFSSVQGREKGRRSLRPWGEGALMGVYACNRYNVANWRSHREWCTFFVQNGSHSTFSHTKSKRRESFDVELHIPLLVLTLPTVAFY